MKKLFWDFKYRGVPLIIWIGALGLGVLVGFLEEKTGISIEIIKENSFLNKLVSIALLILFLFPVYFLIEHLKKRNHK